MTYGVIFSEKLFKTSEFLEASVSMYVLFTSANDMSTSDVRRSQTEAEKNVNRLRNCMPEKLATFCKMHLSFLLELDGAKLEELFLDSSSIDVNANKKKNAAPFSARKKGMQLYNYVYIWYCNVI